MTSASSELSLSAFLGALASGAPVPGGGAAAALCGALAAALAAMVGRVAIARDAVKADEASVLVEKADQLAGRLSALVGEDVRAYEGVVVAGRSNEGAGAVQRALVRATETPLMMARGCRDVLVLSEALAADARPRTVSDLGVAAALAWGALEAAVLTVRANLADVTDAGFVRATERELMDLLAEAGASRERTTATLASRGRPPDGAASS